MKEEVFPELIRKYLQGNCSPEERRQVETWYRSFENDPDLLEFLSEDEKELLKGILFKHIRSSIADHHQVRQRHIWVRYVAGIAALIAIGVGLSWVWRPVDPPDAVAEAIRTIVVTNTDKSLQRVVLPDRTLAWLHPNSSLTYPERFETGLRIVNMTGEVFFDVTPDSLRPFMVYSREVRTKVLGTSFRVRAYPEDPFTQVSVATGKVSVKRIERALPTGSLEPQAEIKEEVVLLPDESVLFSEQQFRKATHAGDARLAMWKKSDVTFENVPVKAVVKRLNSLYGVQIEVTDTALNDYQLKADFTGMNLPDVLEILERSLGLTYEIDGDLIRLKLP